MKTLNNIAKICFVTLITISMSACTNLGKKIGIGVNKTPDEFRITKHAPLEIPQGLTLPVPQPGAPRPQEVTPQQEAQSVFNAQPSSAENAVLNNANDSIAPTTTSNSDAFLDQLGAQDIDPSIRQKVNEDYEDRVNEDVPIGLKVLRLGKKVEPKAETIDPKAERERLQQNSAPQAE
ncbi:MAG: hypothetical protein CMH30_00580 [Micavibrio sp.]|nr:hypothetical protein [Micavibrio sp.]